MLIQNVPQTEEFIHAKMYYRSTKVPEGTLVIGCEHKKDSIAILLSGSIKQIDGDSEYTITAPFVIKTTKGSNRKAYAITDVEYTTITHTDSTELETIEDEMYNQISINKFVRDDFSNMLIGYGLTNDDVEKDMASREVVIINSELYRLDNSGIKGLGIFLNKNVIKDEVIGLAIVNNVKTELGRYVNHSPFPNCFYNESMELVALDNIGRGTELTVNYRRTLDKIFIGGNQ